MIVVASSGLNLPPELIAHCRIEETPNQIVVDGKRHEVRAIDSLQTLKYWMQTAKVPPYGLGSSAPEYVSLFNGLVHRTSEVLVVTGTRKLLGTYDAAVAAARAVRKSRRGFDARVLDTGLVEIGAGLVAAYCGACARAGYGISEVIDAGRQLASASMQLCAPYAVEFLNKLARSDLLQGVIPGESPGLPIIGLKDGEFHLVGTRPASAQAVKELVDILQRRYPPGSALWVAIAFAEDQDPARYLLTYMRRSFDVRYALIRPIGPGGYLFMGAKSLGISVHPVDAMKLLVNLPEAL
jgi:fatty acid-binding protein DegV